MMSQLRKGMVESRLSPLLRPLGAFLKAESAGGILLFAAAIVALIWANSPWGDFYHSVWRTNFSFALGRVSLAGNLELAVNDGLMVIFFLLVGLEIKRELLIGELSSMRSAALPIAAAIGGMLAPALIYASFNARGEGAAGWGIPMATDIAFATGVLMLVGRSLPASVKVFLLAVAIVDDLGAVIIIALFYTYHVSIVWLAIAGGLLVLLILLNLLGVHRLSAYLIPGVGLWAATLFSGIHPTIAGVLLACTIPATRQIEETPYVAVMREALELFEQDAAAVPDKITQNQSHALNTMALASQAVQTPLARLEHALLIPVNFFVIPLFALANCGVAFHLSERALLASPILWGILAGLVIGKPLGVLTASWIAVRFAGAKLPAGASWRDLIGVAVLCGIGFTMSLFIATLAFMRQEQLVDVAKIGILLGSLVSGLGGTAILLTRGSHGRTNQS